LAPPQRVAATKDSPLFTQASLNEFTQLRGEWESRNVSWAYQQGGDVVLQQVRAVTKDAQLLKVGLFDQIDSTLDTLYEQSPDKSQFIENFCKDIQLTLTAFRVEPLLAIDFQIMVDTLGNVHHVDLDRVLSNSEIYAAEFLIHTLYRHAFRLFEKIDRWVELHSSSKSKKQFNLGGGGVSSAFQLQRFRLQQYHHLFWESEKSETAFGDVSKLSDARVAASCSTLNSVESMYKKSGSYQGIQNPLVYSMVADLMQRIEMHETEKTEQNDETTGDPHPPGSSASTKTRSGKIDFFVAGFPKCGTTSLHEILMSHEEVTMPQSEQCVIDKSRYSVKEAFDFVVSEIDKIDASSLEQKQVRGGKCPMFIWNSKRIENVASSFGLERIVVGVRHPILFFQSFYNYRVLEFHEGKLHKNRELQSPPSAESLIGQQNQWEDVSTFSAQFEKALKGIIPSGDSSPLSLVKVFIYSAEQLKGGASELFRNSLKDFLGLQRPVKAIIHSNKNDALERKMPYVMDICDERYIGLRDLLTKNAIATSRYLLDEFINERNVEVGDIEQFRAIVETWSNDPCLETEETTIAGTNNEEPAREENEGYERAKETLLPSFYLSDSHHAETEKKKLFSFPRIFAPVLEQDADIIADKRTTEPMSGASSKSSDSDIMNDPACPATSVSGREEIGVCERPNIKSVSPLLTCSDVHGLDLQKAIVSRTGDSGEDRWKIELRTQGGTRSIWKLTDRENESSYVLKIQLLAERLFGKKRYEDAWIDALAMESLSKSPFALDLFSFCGLSSIGEFAGNSLGSVLPNSDPERKLRLATDIAQGLADLHDVEKEERTGLAIVHNDISSSNFVLADPNGPVKLNDFNAAQIQCLRNQSSCGYYSREKFGSGRGRRIDVRAPEELVQGNVLTEKIDVYGFGSILYFILADGKRMYSLEERELSDEEKRDRILSSILPTMPSSLKNTTSRSISAIRLAMDKALQFNPLDRPSAQELADLLRASKAASHH